MKNKVNFRCAFSLVELLVALSILAVVAAIIVPRFLNVREEAVQVTAEAQIKELNNVYKKWAVLGGRITTGGTTATAIQIVQFLCTERDASTGPISGNPCRDSTSAFGSYTVGLSSSVPGAAAAVTSSTTDGFVNATAANGLSSLDGTTTGNLPAGLAYKQGNFVFPVTFNAGSTGSPDGGSFVLGTGLLL